MPGADDTHHALCVSSLRQHGSAPGLFWVERDMCIGCGAPEAAAPDLIAFVRARGRDQCHFEKQPETEAELERAIEAVSLACCGAYHYDGSDPEIVRRLLAAGARPSNVDGLGPLTRLWRSITGAR